MLLFVLSWPLVLGWIPMNKLYGVRFPQSYKSEEHWKRINRSGGIGLCVVGAIILILGLVGLVYRDIDGKAYTYVSAGIEVGLVLCATLVAYIRARIVDKELTADSGKGNR